jgi:hypothetical protein
MGSAVSADRKASARRPRAHARSLDSPYTSDTNAPPSTDRAPELLSDALELARELPDT